MVLKGRIYTVLFFFQMIGICVAPCPDNVGVPNGGGADQGQDLTLGIAVFQSTYIVNCCGFITSWTTDSYSSGTVNAQVWRDDGTGTDRLLGSNTLTVSGIDGQTHTIGTGDRIRVDVNDIIGVHSTGTFPLKIEQQSANTKGRIVTGLTTDMALTTPWPPGGSDSGTIYDYAIIAHVTQSAAPAFTDLNPVLVYNEDMTVGMILKTMDATQNDPGDLTFTITAGASTYFTIASGSINITLVNIPPKANYTLTVSVTDPCGQDTDGNVVIHVVNKPPIIHNLDDTISISEDTAPSTLIFSVNATDVLVDPVVCSLSGTSTEFQVNGADNGVYVKAGVTFDYDVTPSYTIDVSCTDNDDDTIGTLTVNLIKNEPPVINSLPDSTSFLEDLNTRTLLHTLNVTDPTNDAITCVLDPISTIFDLSYIPSTTVYGLYLTGGTTLDYDTTPSYSLPVKCADNRRNDIDTFTVNLIRNTPPVINSLPSSTNISEELATRTLLHTLNVTDVNAADVITCSLTTFNSLFELVKIGASDDYGIFLLGGTRLDYDIVNSYALSITCGDHRRDVTDIFTVFLIRNEPPTILNLPHALEIAEATSIETLLYTVSATDPTNDTITCSTVSAAIFRIENGASGSVSESKIYLTGNAGLHYDTQKSYTIEVTCADQRRNDSSTLYVYVTRNMPPYFTNLHAKTTFSAISLVGTSLFTAMADDPENDQLQYSLSSVSGNAPFVINQNTGEITLSRAIQYESTTGYDLLVSVSDGRNTYGPKILTVLISDLNSPPSFRNLPQTITVLEIAAIGSTIFTPAVDDKDPTDTHEYTAIMSPPEGAVYFNVNKTTGALTIKSDVDYETIPVKTFLVTYTVTDSLMEDIQNLTINILNVNEAPRFTKKNYAFTVSENVKNTVLQNPYYEYNDQDGDTVKFSFNCGSGTGLLDMNSANGFFSYAVDYDLDEGGMPSLLQCEVYINDAEYSDIAYLNITVTDQNDNTPAFQHDDYTFYMPITTAVGTAVGQVLATDVDTGNNGNIHYHLDQAILDAGLFTVSSDGTITLTNAVESFATEGSVFNMTVYAVDNGALEDQTTVYIVIPDTTNTQNNVDDTIQYFTFFTYAPNMAWFVVALVTTAIAIGFVGYIIWKYGCCDPRDLKDIFKWSLKKANNPNVNTGDNSKTDKRLYSRKKTERQNKTSRGRYAIWNPWKVWERK